MPLVDFDAVVRDPDNPARYFSAYGAQNGFSLTDDGRRAIAESIDLSIFD